MPTLFLVGDSTVANYDLTIEDRDFLYPRNGYGMWLSRYFYSSLFIKNLALSGRSTKSFLAEDNYKFLKENLKAGDFLLIAFGHNDQKYLDETRFTFGEGGIDDRLSYKFHLYNYYVKLAKDAQATPILCTSIVRRSEDGNYVGDRVHAIGSVECYGKTFPKSDYAKAVRELSADCGVDLIDMTEITKNYYTEIGCEKTKLLHATLSMDEKDVDNTHLNSYGALVVARLLVENLKNSDCALKKYLLDDFYNPSLLDRIENK